MEEKQKSSRYIAIIFIITGFLIFLYPTIANLFSKLNQAEVIREYSQKIECLDEEKTSEEYQKAINYNLGLINSETLDISEKEKNQSKYETILNINNDDILGYIEIPNINIKLPIYHSTKDEVIEKGVGHLKQSSFPTEGKNIHTILTSHTGLPKAKLFTDIDKLNLDDFFYITILNKKFCYKVCDKKVVLPEEVNSLKIKLGENLCTLVTCTPYGVNSHRLLITGRFMEYQETKEEIKQSIEKVNKSKNLSFIFVLSLLILFIIIIFIVKNKKIKKEVIKNENEKKNK